MKQLSEKSIVIGRCSERKGTTFRSHTKFVVAKMVERRTRETHIAMSGWSRKRRFTKSQVNNFYFNVESLRYFIFYCKFTIHWSVSPFFCRVLPLNSELISGRRARLWKCVQSSIWLNVCPKCSSTESKQWKQNENAWTKCEKIPFHCMWGIFNVCHFLKCKIGLTEIEQKHYSAFICRKKNFYYSHTQWKRHRETQRTHKHKSKETHSRLPFPIFASLPFAHPVDDAFSCLVVMFILYFVNAIHVKAKQKIFADEKWENCSNYWWKPGDMATHHKDNEREHASGRMLKKRRENKSKRKITTTTT